MWKCWFELVVKKIEILDFSGSDALMLLVLLVFNNLRFHFAKGIENALSWALLYVCVESFISNSFPFLVLFFV